MKECGVLKTKKKKMVGNALIPTVRPVASVAVWSLVFELSGFFFFFLSVCILNYISQIRMAKSQTLWHGMLLCTFCWLKGSNVSTL